MGMKCIDITKNILIFALVVAIVAYGGYKLFNSSVFDTDGSYVKEMVKDKDIKGYVKKAEKGSYISMFTETEEMIGKPVRFWGRVKEKDTRLNRSVQYVLELRITETHDKELKAMYKIKPNEEMSWSMVVNTSEQNDGYDIGNEVFIYGELEKLAEYKGMVVPYMDVKLIEIDKGN